MANNRKKISEGTKVIILDQFGKSCSEGVVTGRTHDFFKVLDEKDNVEKWFPRGDLKKNKWQ